MNKTNIINLLKQYQPETAEEAKYKKDIIDFITANEVYLGKGNINGHITGSAWILNIDKSKALLTHHSKLDKWLQLGGHTEEYEDVLCSALREAVEESGLKTLKIVSSNIFDIDVHLIPERKNEKEHYHYDVRFLLECDDKEPLTITAEESKDLKWIPIHKIIKYSQEQSISRMVRKTFYLK